MKNLQRGIRVFALIALFVTGMALMAQEATEEAEPEATELVTEEMTQEPEVTEVATEAPEATEMVEETPEVIATDLPTTIEEVAGSSARVVGSGIVNPALQALVDASGSIVTYDFTTTGSSAGFEQFCAGLADMTTATRPIAVAEDTLCNETGVEYLELLIGYDVTVVVSNPADDFLTCLTTANLSSLFAPSATAINWSDVNLAGTTPPSTEGEAEATEEATTLPEITVLLPQDTSVAYTTLDDIVSGFGFRADASNADTATIIDTVASTSGAIGVVPLEVALANQETVSILGLDTQGIGCSQPSIETIEASSYPAVTPLYLYVATNAQETLAFFLDFLTNNESSSALTLAGYTPVSVETYEVNRAIVLGEASPRALTAEEVTYQIPPNLSGAVNIVGATSGFSIASGNAQRLASTQQGLTINNNFNGQVAGIEAFCNGEADILFVGSDAEAVCEGTVNYVNYNFGQQAVVLVSNAGDNYTTCLTLDQINTIWSASSAETISQWSNISEAFPEQNLTLVGVNSGNILTDIMMNAVTDGVANPVRSDVAETNSDPLYRGAAIANVSGALTYMSWVDYQDVIETGQANTQLVAVDNGSGCVVPSVETISDGSYALTRSLSMLVKESSLATVPVQSLVWSMFTDGNYTIIDAFDFVGGIEPDNLSEFRNDLLIQFEEAEQAQLVAPEATPEITPEATAEAEGE